MRIFKAKNRGRFPDRGGGDFPNFWGNAPCRRVWLASSSISQEKTRRKKNKIGVDESKLENPHMEPSIYWPLRKTFTNHAVFWDSLTTPALRTTAGRAAGDVLL